jgi:hypothetical protein
MIEALVMMGNMCLNQMKQEWGICNINPSKPALVKYYEPGKSCYINGTFYRDCAEKE